eukprot:TRINITY_DN61807_c0_g1_i1.p1 TRINITY_DN61807_c0_g1~~TRINITY_DN61807_c0_g1_i1.p1  ORF type:complete len:724 (+),score=73.66 TRINITY_DN61807_c0_g1_i1:87-2258(+)
MRLFRNDHLQSTGGDERSVSSWSASTAPPAAAGYHSPNCPWGPPQRGGGGRRNQGSPAPERRGAAGADQAPEAAALAEEPEFSAGPGELPSPGGPLRRQDPYAPLPRAAVRRGGRHGAVNASSFSRYAVCDHPPAAARRRIASLGDSGSSSSDEAVWTDGTEAAGSPAARACESWGGSHLRGWQLPTLCRAADAPGSGAPRMVVPAVPHPPGRQLTTAAEDTFAATRGRSSANPDDMLASLSTLHRGGDVLRLRVACAEAALPAVWVEVPTTATVAQLTAKAIAALSDAGVGPQLRQRLNGGWLEKADGEELRVPMQRLGEVGVHHRAALLLRLPGSQVVGRAQGPPRDVEEPASELVRRFCELPEQKDGAVTGAPPAPAACLCPPATLAPGSGVSASGALPAFGIGGAAARIAVSAQPDPLAPRQVEHPARLWLADFVQGLPPRRAEQATRAAAAHQGGETAMVQQLIADFGDGARFQSYDAYVARQRALRWAAYKPGVACEEFADDQTGNTVALDAAGCYSVRRGGVSVCPVSEHPARQWFVEYLKARAPGRAAEVDRLLWEWLYDEEGLRDSLIAQYGDLAGISSWESYAQKEAVADSAGQRVLQTRGPWQRIQGPGGGVYYWNEATGVSQWDAAGTPFATPEPAAARGLPSPAESVSSGRTVTASSASTDLTQPADGPGDTMSLPPPPAPVARDGRMSPAHLAADLGPPASSSSRRQSA